MELNYELLMDALFAGVMTGAFTFILLAIIIHFIFDEGNKK
jgi:hypothetical protein